MRLLLDTHVVLWELSGERRVSQAAEEAILQASELLVSGLAVAISRCIIAIRSTGCSPRRPSSSS
jgi:PIN domain nuclease of toxin-antitoxin system